MILTCRKHAPFHWLFATATSAAIFMYMWCAMSNAFLFSLKKFLDNPAGLTFIMSVPALLHLFFAPYVNFMSDRIWTRFGRRKPLVLAGWGLACASMIAMPLMPNFWLLIVAYLGFQIALDLRGPIEPLQNEIVPPWQRGRFSAVSQWMGNLGILSFNFLALGRFDDRQFYLGIPLGGESAIYWTTAAGLLLLVLFISLGIKETNPKSAVSGERFSMKGFFTSITNRNLFPVYFLIFGSAMLNAGLGTMGTLLYTDQWQFTKQEMGNNAMVGGVINLFLIVILGLFADKMNRMKAYQTLMFLTVFINFAFYLYINFFLYDRRPVLLELVLFGETLSILGILIGMCYQPMVYDYVPRNEMGTYMAGSSLLGRITGLITLNGVGLFIWAYSALFLPPGGDMTRVVFKHSQTSAQVEALLAKNTWVDTVKGEPIRIKDMSSRPWYGSGAYLNFGTAYEIRMGNPDSIRLKKERDEAESERLKLANLENNLLARIRILERSKPKDPSIDSLRDEAQALKTKARPFLDSIEQIDKELSRRGKELHAQVVARFGQELLPEGQQIEGLSWGSASIFSFPTKIKIPSESLERLLLDLRHAFPEVIDLRPTRTADSFGLNLSVKGTVSPDRQVKILTFFQEQCTAKLDKYMDFQAKPDSSTVPLLSLEVKVIEEPMDIHLSPVAKLVNTFMGWFTLPSGPDRKILAFARALRKTGETEHTLVENIPPTTKDDFAVRILAIPTHTPADQASTASPADPVALSIARFLKDPAQAAIARQLFDRAVLTGKDVRLNIPTQELVSGFVPQTYDYMAGYIWMFMLGLLGLAITFVFALREKKGLISKRGLEEAASHSKQGAQQHLAPTGEEFETDPSTGRVVTYTPGYVPHKLAFFGISAGIFLLGAAKLFPDLNLILSGNRAQAEVVRIIKTREGLPEEVVTRDEQWKSVELMQDRSSTYWNEFSFTDANGQAHLFRSAFGSQFRPLNPLLDSDGLPSTQWIFYDPATPERITQPMELSNWFVSLTLTTIGLIGLIVSGMLLYHARRPIAVPFIAVEAKA